MIIFFSCYWLFNVIHAKPQLHQCCMSCVNLMGFSVNGKGNLVSSINSGNLINHCKMNTGELKTHSYPCLVGTVVTIRSFSHIW